MAITLNGTTGITTPAVTNNGAYTGDGVVFADATPSNTLVTDTSGNVGIGTTETSAFTSVAGNTRLCVTGSSSSTDVAGNTNASIMIANTDDTANNTAGLHFAWQDSDNSPNYVGASIVGVLGTKVAGQYPAGQIAFLTSTATNEAPTEKMRITSAGNLQFNSGYGSVATAYGCRAWVNFNGTGTVAIRASGNVTSITDNGTGDYTVNFTTAMPDANYSIAGSAGLTASNLHGIVNLHTANSGADVVPTTSAFRFITSSNVSGTADNDYINLVIFR